VARLNALAWQLPQSKGVWYRLPDLSDFDAEIACSLPMVTVSALKKKGFILEPVWYIYVQNEVTQHIKASLFKHSD